MTSIQSAPDVPKDDPKLSKRQRLIQDIGELSKASGGGGDPERGESGDKVSESATGTHPMFVMSLLLKMALGLALFMSILSAISTLLSADRTTTNVTMFALSLAVAFGVLEIYHKTRVEEILFMHRAARMGYSRSPSLSMVVSKYVFQSTIVVHLIAVIIDMRNNHVDCGGSAGGSDEETDEHQMSNSFVIFTSFCISMLILISIIFVVRTDVKYTIRDV